jgi:uncharacterized low-complexity protein
MKTTMMKLGAALGLAGALTLGAATASFAQNPYSQQNSCIPQYDSSGAQKAPYC